MYIQVVSLGHLTSGHQLPWSRLDKNGKNGTCSLNKPPISSPPHLPSPLLQAPLDSLVFGPTKSFSLHVMKSTCNSPASEVNTVIFCGQNQQGHITASPARRLYPFVSNSLTNHQVNASGNTGVNCIPNCGKLKSETMQMTKLNSAIGGTFDGKEDQVCNEETSASNVASQMSPKASNSHSGNSSTLSDPSSGGGGGNSNGGSGHTYHPRHHQQHQHHQNGDSVSSVKPLTSNNIASSTSAPHPHHQMIQGKSSNDGYHFNHQDTSRTFNQSIIPSATRVKGCQCCVNTVNVKRRSHHNHLHQPHHECSSGHKSGGHRNRHSHHDQCYCGQRKSSSGHRRHSSMRHTCTSPTPGRGHLDNGDLANSCPCAACSVNVEKSSPVKNVRRKSGHHSVRRKSSSGRLFLSSKVQSTEVWVDGPGDADDTDDGHGCTCGDVNCVHPKTAVRPHPPVRPNRMPQVTVDSLTSTDDPFANLIYDQLINDQSMTEKHFRIQEWLFQSSHCKQIWNSILNNSYGDFDDETRSKISATLLNSVNKVYNSHLKDSHCGPSRRRSYHHRSTCSRKNRNSQYECDWLNGTIHRHSTTSKSMSHKQGQSIDSYSKQLNSKQRLNVYNDSSINEQIVSDHRHGPCPCDGCQHQGNQMKHQNESQLANENDLTALYSVSQKHKSKSSLKSNTSGGQSDLENKVNSSHVTLGEAGVSNDLTNDSMNVISSQLHYSKANCEFSSTCKLPSQGDISNCPNGNSSGTMSSGHSTTVINDITGDANDPPVQEVLAGGLNLNAITKAQAVHQVDHSLMLTMDQILHQTNHQLTYTSLPRSFKCKPRTGRKCNNFNTNFNGTNGHRPTGPTGESFASDSEVTGHSSCHLVPPIATLSESTCDTDIDDEVATTTDDEAGTMSEPISEVSSMARQPPPPMLKLEQFLKQLIELTAPEIKNQFMSSETTGYNGNNGKNSRNQGANQVNSVSKVSESNTNETFASGQVIHQQMKLMNDITTKGGSGTNSMSIVPASALQGGVLGETTVTRGQGTLSGESQSQLKNYTPLRVQEQLEGLSILTNSSSCSSSGNGNELNSFEGTNCKLYSTKALNQVTGSTKSSSSQLASIPTSPRVNRLLTSTSNSISPNNNGKAVSLGESNCHQLPSSPCHSVKSNSNSPSHHPQVPNHSNHSSSHHINCHSSWTSMAQSFNSRKASTNSSPYHLQQAAHHGHPPLLAYHSDHSLSHPKQPDQGPLDHQVKGSHVNLIQSHHQQQQQQQQQSPCHSSSQLPQGSTSTGHNVSAGTSISDSSSTDRECYSLAYTTASSPASGIESLNCPPGASGTMVASTSTSTSCNTKKSIAIHHQSSICSKPSSSGYESGITTLSADIEDMDGSYDLRQARSSDHQCSTSTICTPVKGGSKCSKGKPVKASTSSTSATSASASSSAVKSPVKLRSKSGSKLHSSESKLASSSLTNDLKRLSIASVHNNKCSLLCCKFFK